MRLSINLREDAKTGETAEQELRNLGMIMKLMLKGKKKRMIDTIQGPEDRFVDIVKWQIAKEIKKIKSTPLKKNKP